MMASMDISDVPGIERVKAGWGTFLVLLNQHLYRLVCACLTFHVHFGCGTFTWSWTLYGFTLPSSPHFFFSFLFQLGGISFCSNSLLIPCFYGLFFYYTVVLGIFCNSCVKMCVSLNGQCFRYIERYAMKVRTGCLHTLGTFLFCSVWGWEGELGYTFCHGSLAVCDSFEFYAFVLFVLICFHGLCSGWLVTLIYQMSIEVCVTVKCFAG